MTSRARLLFPYLCALFVLALVVGDRMVWSPSGAATPPPMSCHEAATSAGPQAGQIGGLPAPLYYGSIAMVLLVSFGIIEWRAKRTTSPTPPTFDLLAIPGVRKIVVHPATRPLFQLSMIAFFVLIIAAGLFGNQLPNKNLAPLLTWTVWWCGLVLIILYAGKAWCYVCPWDAIAGWAEGLRLRSPRREHLSLGLHWPRVMRNIWPATILFVALTWVELGFGVTMRPRATAWLALVMLGLAFVSAFLFDRKSFCLHGCLVGRISGLYALFSPVEVRAADREVCRTCSTHSCYTGNDQGDPCPTFQYLGTMNQNTYCISCMECVKSCEVDNVAIRVRPWGEDLRTLPKPRSDEAYLALIMLSLTGFHGLTMTAAWGRMVERIQHAMGIGEPVAFTLGMCAIIVGPVLLYAALVAVSRWVARDQSGGYREHFLRYAYALLPIALFYHLAHNSEHLLMEGQKVIALASDPFGYEWNIFGTAMWTLDPLVSMETLWVIQVLLVLVGHVYSLSAARQTASALFADRSAATKSQVPMLLAMILFSVMSLWLLKQPMSMRVSWM